MTLKQLFNLLLNQKEKSLDKLIDAMFQIQGGYSSNDDEQKTSRRKRSICIRLYNWKIKKFFIFFSSETCALDIIGGNLERENGEIVIIENEELKSLNLFPSRNQDHFEYIYFARPDSLIGNKCAMNIEKFRAELARETDLHADLVVPVPDPVFQQP